MFSGKRIKEAHTKSAVNVNIAYLAHSRDGGFAIYVF